MTDWEKVFSQLSVVANAPIPFLIALLIAAGLIWWALEWRYGGILTNKDSEIALAKSQRDDYREKLGGASPDQAKAKIETLEHTVDMVIGKRWSPLTNAEIQALAEKLKTIPKSRAQIMYENPLGKDLAQSFLEAFKAAGWDAAWVSTGSGFGSEILAGWGSRAVALKEAIESSTKMSVRALELDSQVVDLCILGVGINTSPR